MQPRDWTEVKAQSAGEIASVSVRSGESVKRGQVLARLDARDLKARLADKRAALAGARAQLELATRKRDTTRAMFARDLVAQMELDSAESAYRVSEASVASLQAQVEPHFLCLLERLAGIHHAQILAVFVDHPNLRGLDEFVVARAGELRRRLRAARIGRWYMRSPEKLFLSVAN